MTAGPTPKRRWALDVFIVAAIVGLGWLHEHDDAGEISSWLFTIALALPLLWRRRAPIAVFGAIAAVATVQWALDIRAFGDGALLVALYTVAANRPLRTALATAAVLEIGVVMAVARWGADQHGFDAFIALSALTTAALLLGINVRHRQALLASLRERAAQLEAERDQQGRLAAAAERSRIAREMHDVVAHNLSVMIALADGATYAIRDAPAEAEVAMRNASRTGREALTEMRRLLGVLRAGEPADERTPQPGIGQLDALVEQVRGAGMPTTITVSGVPAEHASGGLELAAYRIVQEALTNALKHGGEGAQARVDLRWRGRELHLEILNTGASGAEPIGDGGGLRGMRERAAVYDGSVSAGPVPGGGWKVVARLVQADAPVEVVA